MQSFSLIIYFYVYIRVSNTQILSHNDPWILKVSIFFRKPLSFNFLYTGGYLYLSQWSVFRHAKVFSEYLFSCLDKGV